MLETIHEYAREKLAESGEAAALRREHALYFMRLAEQAEHHMLGKEQQDWLERLEEEYDNIRAALYWARDAGGGESEGERGTGQERGTEPGLELGVVEDEDRQDEAVPAVQIGLRIATAIERFWNVRGYYSEGREQLNGLLELEKGENTEYKANRAKALNAAGVMAARQGDYSIAHSLHEVSLALFRELGDKWGMASSLNYLANVAHERGDQPSARSMYEESLAIRRELGDSLGIASSLTHLGIVAVDQGNYALARSLYEESLAIGRELGDKWDIAISLHNLGLVALEQGDYATARSLYEESLAIAREPGDKPGIVYLLAGLGEVEVRSAGQVGTTGGGAGEIGDIGASRARSGLRKGARLLGAVEALLESIGTVMWSEERRPYELAVAQVRTQLGEQEFEKARAEGRAMSMEEAIEYALQRSPEE